MNLGTAIIGAAIGLAIAVLTSGCETLGIGYRIETQYGSIGYVDKTLVLALPRRAEGYAK